MDLTLTLKQKAIRKMARQFAENELAPIAREIDAERRFPWEIIEKMGPLNFFGMQAPRKYGGAEMDSISYCIALEELSRICAAIGLTIAVHNGVAVYPISVFANETQKRKFIPSLAAGEKIGGFCLTEPNAGSDANAIEATAVPNGDDYIVNANKIYVTNGGAADILLVFTSMVSKDVKGGMGVLIVERGARDYHRF